MVWNRNRRNESLNLSSVDLWRMMNRARFNDNRFSMEDTARVDRFIEATIRKVRKLIRGQPAGLKPVDERLELHLKVEGYHIIIIPTVDSESTQ